MKCSNCGAMLHPNAKFCVKCGTRVLAQKAGAEPQNAEPNKKNGVSDPGTVSFDAPGQNHGMGQYARSRASYMDAAYSNVGGNPEETAGNRYTPQEPANYKSQNGNEYTSAYGEASQESLKYRNQSGNAYRSVYGGTPQESLKYGNQGGNEYTSAYGGTPQESLKYGNQGGNEYTSAYGEAPQESLKYGNQGGNEYTSAYGEAPQESLKYGNQDGNEYTSAYGEAPQESLKYGNQGGNEYTSAYGEAPQESLKYSSQGRTTSPAMGDYDDMGTASYSGSTDEGLYTESLGPTSPDSGAGPQNAFASGNPYIYPENPAEGGGQTRPKSRLSFLIVGEVIAILAVGAILVFLLFGRDGVSVFKKDDSTTETTANESRNSPAESNTGSRVTATPTETAVPTVTPTPETPVPTKVPTQIPTSTPVPTQIPTSTPVPTQAPTPVVETISCYNGVQAPANEFVFPYSSQRYLTQAELNSLIGDTEYMHMQSQLAINEIFARYGYTFKKDTPTAQDARNHFEGHSWYVTLQGMCPTQNSDDLKNYYMNAYEQANIKMLNDWQMEHDVYY